MHIHMQDTHTHTRKREQLTTTDHTRTDHTLMTTDHTPAANVPFIPRRDMRTITLKRIPSKRLLKVLVCTTIID